MEQSFRDMSSLFSFFYNDECQFQTLSLLYQNNVKSFDKKFDLENEIPSYYSMKRFLVTLYMAKTNQRPFEFKLFFKMFKECLLCLISMGEITFERSFDTFVNLFFFY